MVKPRNVDLTDGSLQPVARIIWPVQHLKEFAVFLDLVLTEFVVCKPNSFTQILHNSASFHWFIGILTLFIEEVIGELQPQTLVANNFWSQPIKGTLILW